MDDSENHDCDLIRESYISSMLGLQWLVKSFGSGKETLELLLHAWTRGIIMDSGTEGAGRCSVIIGFTRPKQLY